MSRPIVSRPIYSIGRFYGQLPDAEKANARRLAKVAHRLPKCTIEDEYYRLKGVAEHANYV